MHARFYAPDLEPGRAFVDLPREEADHLSRVLRLRTGDAVQVFDGRGREFRGTVGQVGRGAVRVALGEEVSPVAEPSVRVTLIQAVPKGDAMDRIVRDATMLGVADIVPLVSARAEVSGRRLERSARVERWQRIAVASAKQCGRAVVPGVRAPQSLEECLARVSADRRYLLAEPSLQQTGATSVRRLLGASAPSSAALIVGPEGGWSEEELGAARQAECVPLTLGPRTLRADAAAAVAVAVLQAMWGDL